MLFLVMFIVSARRAKFGKWSMRPSSPYYCYSNSPEGAVSHNQPLICLEFCLCLYGTSLRDRLSNSFIYLFDHPSTSLNEPWIWIVQSKVLSFG